MTTLNGELCLKFAMAGNTNVGKTALSTRFINGAFHPVPPPRLTIGVEYQRKELHLSSHADSSSKGEDRDDDKKGADGIIVHLWDPMGSERFRAISPGFYRNSAALLIVFDLTDRSSFLDVPRWVSEIPITVARSDIQEERLAVALLGNKLDLVQSDPSQRRVTTEEAEQLAKELRIDFYRETSAVTGEGVVDGFRMLGHTVLDKSPHIAADLRRSKTGGVRLPSTSSVVRRKPHPKNPCW